MVDALNRFLDFVYGSASNLDPVPVKLVAMYLRGLAALLIINMALHWVLLKLRVQSILIFRRRGHHGTIEAMRFAARLYCLVGRTLYALDPNWTLV